MTVESILSAISSFDQSIILTVNQLAGRERDLDRIIFHVADLNLLKGVPFMACAWYFWFRRDGTARVDVVNLLGVALVAIVAGRLLQLGLPGRLRPVEDPTLALVMPGHARPGVLSDWSSFPSDHALLFFAMAAALTPMSRLLAAAAAAWTALVVCLPRLYLGYHYAGDLLVGAIVGVAVAFACLRLTPRRLSESVVGLADRSPGLFYAAAFVFTYELSVLMGDVRQLGEQALKFLHVVTA
jgi:undecaprenyl-diphosphatase